MSLAHSHVPRDWRAKTRLSSAISSSTNRSTPMGMRNDLPLATSDTNSLPRRPMTPKLIG